MGAAVVIFSIVIAAIALASAMAKLTRQPRIVETLGKVGVKPAQLPILAALEIAGAIGVLIGLAVPGLGLAAAIGLTLYFVGAVLAHLRAHDPAWPPPAMLAVVALVALVLRAATL